MVFKIIINERKEEWTDFDPNQDIRIWGDIIIYEINCDELNISVESENQSKALEKIKRKIADLKNIKIDEVELKTEEDHILEISIKEVIDFNIWEELAKKGDVDAQFKLGKCYYTGSGITRDYPAAAHWFGKAAEQGNDKAQHWLATMYEYHIGIPMDLNKAIELYSKAAAQGHEEAQKRLEALKAREKFKKKR